MSKKIILKLCPNIHIHCNLPSEMHWVQWPSEPFLWFDLDFPKFSRENNEELQFKAYTEHSQQNRYWIWHQGPRKEEEKKTIKRYGPYPNKYKN